MSLYVVSITERNPNIALTQRGAATLRRAALAAAVAVIALVAAAAIPAVPALQRLSPGARAAATASIDPAIDRKAASVSVIVQARPGAVAQAREALRETGATVVAELPLVHGFEAELSGAAVERLAASPAVRAISDNAEAAFEEYSYDETTTASSFARTSGATRGWANGFLGQGVGVAVIDTGVSAMNDLKARIAYGPDLSGEGTNIDTYGHGTVMAGIIGGSGADSATNAGGAYTGVAPKATLVPVKVAGRNGVVDVSTMLQAMHWVAAYKSQFNIRVLNLSWGTKSTQHHSLDPLNYAVQRLWRQGIVVVVAAGNSGPGSGTVTKPGDDPMVITVGSFDDKQNTDTSDDSLSPWSSRGPTAAGVRKPDVVAPGRSLIASRSYGSYVEANYPKAHVSPSYIKGSGTSQAAAVVSGLAAQLIQANAALTPDQVKAALMGTASPLPAVSSDNQGAGRVRLGAALAAAPSATTQLTTATGLGSIEQSRGGMNVETDCNGDGTYEVIIGEIDVRCEPWDPVAWTTSAWDGSAWMGDAWEVTGWEPALWDGRAWTGGTWTGRAWTGRAWTGSTWTDSSWTGRAWTGASWTGTSWTTAEYGDWTTAEYDEFQTAWWGPVPPKRFKALGERDDPPGLGIATAAARRP